MKSLLFVLLILLGSFLYSIAGWQIETVDTISLHSGCTSLALDSYDHPHIIYYAGNNQLRYAFNNGANWSISIIDNSSVYESTSIALDTLDLPNISYEDSQSGLKYAHYDGSSWIKSDVDGIFGFETSIALDKGNKPHISYNDLLGSSLKYASLIGSNWQIMILDSGTYVGENSSLALDSLDRPHISYTGDGTNRVLKYAYNDGFEWHITVIDSAISSNNTSIAIDNEDKLHIAYVGNDDNLKYAYYNGSYWETTIVDTDDLVSDPSLALDKNNKPYITYYSYNMALKYARYDGTIWHISTIDSGLFGLGTYSSIALDSNELSHISYYNGWETIKYAHFVISPSVSLLSFTAQPQLDSSLKLIWQVGVTGGTEILGFNLYRAAQDSTNKKDWTRLNPSPITGSNPHQFVDNSVSTGQIYTYRLSALTSDGMEEELGTTQGNILTTPARFALTAVYPNPAKSLLSCRLTLPHAGPVTLALYDVSGRLVLSKQVELASGEQELTLDVGNMTRGIYTVQANCGGEKAFKRIVVGR